MISKKIDIKYYFIESNRPSCF